MLYMSLHHADARAPGEAAVCIGDVLRQYLWNARPAADGEPPAGAGGEGSSLRVRLLNLILHIILLLQGDIQEQHCHKPSPLSQRHTPHLLE